MHRSTGYFFLAASLIVFIIPAVACSRPDHPGLPPGLERIEYPNPADIKKTQVPWEVRGPDGQVYLPDIFYADPVQNRQVMPLTVEIAGTGGAGKVKYAVNRLIYPTIGNPNLFVRNGRDVLTVVLRMKPSNFAHLEPVKKSVDEHSPHLEEITFAKADAENKFLFYLVPRKARNEAERSEKANARRIKPIIASRVVRYAKAGLPKSLRRRTTLRFDFNAAAMKRVRPDLYDLRVEILKQGKLAVHEFQYNAVRVFPAGADGNRYSILNVTDSQVSISTLLDAVDKSKAFKFITHDKLRDFVDFVNTSRDAGIRNARFITFNGDLHNGGSPGTLLPGPVAETYQKEAASIVTILRRLNFPIFLTPGNHDGYVSTGHVPGAIKFSLSRKHWVHLLFGWLTGSKKPARTLKEVVTETRSGAVWKNLRDYLEDTEDIPGGRHIDLYAGQYIRRRMPGKKGIYWVHVPHYFRNRILYDGFHQWRRSYGPLYYSWTFGKNHYISLNSFELRQHRRTGWGMYTVNYGGGVSSFQMDWLKRDIALNRKRDVIILSHHDPRGGNNGRDYPYYFKQIDYTGMEESAANYIKGEELNPVLCNKLPDALKTESFALGCIHDGLQEWMRADPDFDCKGKYIIKEGPRAGKCDLALMKKEKQSRIYSGYQLIHRLATEKSVRTLLLGHTHYNSMENYLPGDALVPGKVLLGKGTQQRLAAMEKYSPLRAGSHEFFREKTGLDIGKDNEYFFLNLQAAGHNFKRKLEKHELLILRMTSVAELTTQKTFAPDNELKGKGMYGFTVFDIFPKRDKRAYGRPQINRMVYYQYVSPSGDIRNRYKRIKSLPLSRVRRITRTDHRNPLNKFLELSK